jgi:RimJ/RimL family protein N-acetyltransferase
VRLERLRPEDGPALAEILRDPLVRRMLPARVRREGGIAFVRRVLAEVRAGGGPAFAVRDAGTGSTLGQVRFFHWAPERGEAEIGIWIRRSAWGLGIGTQAIRLACAHAFGVLGARRITARVVAGNERSVGALRRVGFRPEGRTRRSADAPGGWKDELLFGLLRGELRGGRRGRPRQTLPARRNTVSARIVSQRLGRSVRSRITG